MNLHTSSPATLTARTVRTVADLEPQQIGPWQLIRSIGGGDLAEVFLAHPKNQPLDHQPAYVLKKLRRQKEQNPQAIATIRREAYVAQQVSHPRLMAMLSSHLIESPYYLVMPRLDGVTLAERLKQPSSLNLPQALWIARQVAQALTALHSHRWLHADIKPENIMISSDGQVTLIDLGFARQLEEPGSIAHRPVIGTIRYMAPEMITSSVASTIAIDLYSLGATLYEMIAGRPPFISEDIGELISLHRQQRPLPLQKFAPNTPPAVANLVHQLLAKNPLRRGESVSEIVEKLLEFEIVTFDRRFDSISQSLIA